MSLNSKIIDIIEKEIQKFGNYQTQINKSANQNNSGVSTGKIESIDPKTGLAKVRTSTGGLIKGVQPVGNSGFGPNTTGYIVGNTIRND